NPRHLLDYDEEEDPEMEIEEEEPEEEPVEDRNHYLDTETSLMHTLTHSLET
nr:hypothetical protein [Tanacetum cinerariifolium]